jgi:hypothetical protein
MRRGRLALMSPIAMPAMATQGMPRLRIAGAYSWRVG